MEVRPEHREIAEILRTRLIPPVQSVGDQVGDLEQSGCPRIREQRDVGQIAQLSDFACSGTPFGGPALDVPFGDHPPIVDVARPRLGRSYRVRRFFSMTSNLFSRTSYAKCYFSIALQSVRNLASTTTPNRAGGSFRWRPLKDATADRHPRAASGAFDAESETTRSSAVCWVCSQPASSRCASRRRAAHIRQGSVEHVTMLDQQRIESLLQAGSVVLMNGEPAENERVAATMCDGLVNEEQIQRIPQGTARGPA